MKEQIKALRKALRQSQTSFGSMLGVSLSAVQKWESGENEPANSIIELLVQKTGVNEVWLRLGVGEMFAARSRKEELNALIDDVMRDRPDSFRTALITTLLRFKPEQWAVLEQIYNGIQSEREQKKTDTN